MGARAKVLVPVLMIRSEPSPDGAVLAEVPMHTELEVLEWKPRYARVRFADHNREVEGWAATSMLSNASAAGRRLTCPVCGGDEWRETHGGVQTSVFFAAPVHLMRGALDGDGDQIDLLARVCLGCGYVAWFVPRAEMRKL